MRDILVCSIFLLLTYLECRLASTRVKKIQRRLIKKAKKEKGSKEGREGGRKDRREDGRERGRNGTGFLGAAPEESVVQPILLLL